MRLSFVLKLLGCLTLAGALSWATSVMLAQGLGKPRAKPSDPAAQLPGRSTFTVRQRDPVDGPPAAPAARPDLTRAIPATIPASYTKKSFRVESQGWDVVIDAALNMRDTIEGTRYFWALRVYDQDWDGILLAQRLYLDQTFTVPVEEGLNPTFNEHVRLAPGQYRVLVSVHRLLPKDQINPNDPEWLDRHKVFWFGEKITVAPIPNP